MSAVRPNLLDHVPHRTCEWITDDSGFIVLLLPKFGKGRVGRFMDSLLGHRRRLRVHLDLFGSRAWSGVDGASTIFDIALALIPVVGDDDVDAYRRFATFFAGLSRAGAVRLDPPNSTPSSSSVSSP